MDRQIAIFYGSTMGATEKVANIISEQLEADMFNIDSASKEEFDKYDTIIIGSSTWGFGDLQDDWEAFFDMNGIPNLKDKKVAIFGLGDQDDHKDVFVNAIGILHDICKNAGAKIFGYWPIEGYDFGTGTTAVRDGHFLGLPIDEINQAKLTKDRINKWIKQIKEEMDLR